VSTFRKTVLTTAIIGAGLASTAGSAFATSCDSHEGHGSHSKSSDSSCSNDVKALNETKGGGLANVLGGAQAVAPINACHILSDNHLLNGNNVALLGNITDGDSSTTGLLG
jgi:hypothetical protein